MCLCVCLLFVLFHWHEQILIKKSYGDRQKRHKMRNWQIKHLEKEKAEMEVGKAVQDRDYTDFLENLEEDLTYRKNVNVYYGKNIALIASLLIL